MYSYRIYFLNISRHLVQHNLVHFWGGRQVRLGAGSGQVFPLCLGLLVGDLVFMKDSYHRTFGGFGKRLNLEARFISYRENINFKKNKNINTKDRSFGYFPINTIQNINYKNLRFLNKKSGRRSKRDYPVDFSFDFNI